MRYFLVILVLLLGAIGAAQCVPSGANAQVPLAIINKARIKAEAKAFQSVHNQIDKLRESFYQEILSLENQLREQHENIQRLEAVQETKPKKAIAVKLLKEKQAFEHKKSSLEQLVQKRKQQLDEHFQRAYNLIDKTFKDVLSEIIKERSLVLVLNSESVVNDNAPDITNEVIQRLDKQLPTVQLAQV